MVKNPKSRLVVSEPVTISVGGEVRAYQAGDDPGDDIKRLEKLGLIKKEVDDGKD
ncbi:MAG: hypothetical protein HGA54_01695 [Actinobacteria bacterium]|nr:hypothetical protein [Actinomycetota bacterium]